MMPSSSQVLDHQLIFYLMYGLGQFHHWQNKGEERGELEKKAAAALVLDNFIIGKTKGATAGKHRSRRRGEKRRVERKRVVE
jgi:hypothetical protein